MPPGPVPKRSDQRRRMNKPTVPVDIAPAGPAVAIPPLRVGIHPLAAKWYESLGLSGQSRYYEASDWMTAQVVAEAIESFAEVRRPTMLLAILTGASSLLATEGDRRRLRLELMKAGPDVDEEASVTALGRYRGVVGA